MTNDQFKNHINLLLEQVKNAKKETNLDKQNAILESLIQDLQVVLKD